MNQLFPELPLFLSSSPGDTSDRLSIDELRESSRQLRSIDDFPVEIIRRCARLENRFSSDPQSLIRYYVWLAFGCLTSAFIMTQRNSAIRRIESSNNEAARERLLTPIGSGQWFATVGISQLSTSRRHVTQPPLVARSTESGWLLDGYCPWVTGAAHADIIVIGAIAQSLESEQSIRGDSEIFDSINSQMLFAIPTNRPNIACSPGMSLLGLSASCTDVIRLNGVAVTTNDLLHGPCANVMHATRSTNAGPTGASGAGGLQTSALAIGHAAKAIEFLSLQAANRPELRATAEKWMRNWESQFNQLLQFASGRATGDVVLFRKGANDLVLQATQSALAAAKGAGFVDDHDVGRWCCEALFFLVWSCPQAVIDAHLCSLAEVG